MTTKYLEAKMRKIPLSNLVQQYRVDLRNRKLSENTISVYDKVLRAFESYLSRGQSGAQVQLQHVTAAKAKEYIAYRVGEHRPWAGHPLKHSEERALAASTIHQDVRSLKTFGTWLAENGYDNPFSALKTPKLPKLLIDILSDDEIVRLFNAYGPKTHIGARWQAILAMLLGTGLRREELVTLELEHLDLDQGRAKVCGKGNKERFVWFTATTHRYLSTYLNLYRPQPGNAHVFTNVDGTQMTVTGLDDIIRHVRARTGIQRLHCHLFRHTFATKFLLAGGDAFELKALLGHESLEMTNRYVHLASQLARSNGKAPLRRTSYLDNIKITTPRGGPARVAIGDME